MENNRDVFYGKNGIEQRYSKLTKDEKHKVKIAFGNVTGYMSAFGLPYPCGVLDLDLCCTLPGSR